MNPAEAHEHVMRLALGHVASRTVYALVQFRIADHLAAGLRAPAELARVTSTHQPSLLRLLRAGCSLDLLTEEAGECFTLTPNGEALRSDAPRRAASAVMALGGSGIWRAFGEFARSIESGELDARADRRRQTVLGRDGGEL